MDNYNFNIFYIVGRGHSGSTILDLLLGSSRDIESVGELLSGMGRLGDQCACGRKISSCPFWLKVRKKTLEKIGNKTKWDEVVKLSHYFGHIARMPSLILGTRKGKEKICRQYNYALFKAISEVSNKKNVVDSSKEITRAYFLLKNFSNVKLIHLVRNGEEVLSSRLYRMRKRGSYYFLRHNFSAKYFQGFFLFLTTITWIAGNFFVELIRLFNKNKVLRVRYEDLCRDPRNELVRISAFLNCEINSVIKKVEDGQEINIGHNIAGNQIRLSDSVVFRPKSRTKELPNQYKIMFRVLALPFLIYYGYKIL